MVGNPLLEVLGEFGAGYGNPENLAVRFLLAAFFWAVLAVTALRQWRRGGQGRDRWVGASAALGLSRELWMFVMEYGARMGALPHHLTHVLYPPLEHLLAQSAYLCAGAAFADYFGASRTTLRRYLGGNAALILGVYAWTQWAWPRFLADRPHAGFGAFPGDLWQHLFMAWLLAPVLGWLVAARVRGRAVPGTLYAAFAMFLADDLLMIAHLAAGEYRPEVFAPVRHNLHIWAVPVLIAFYWGELTRRLQEERARTEAIVGALGEGVSIHDRDLKVTYQNPAHRELVGNIVGEYCYRAYRHRDGVCEDCPVHAAMVEGRVVRTERVYSHRGKVFAVTASPLRDAAGRVVAGIEVVRDITEQRVLEQRTAEAQKLEAVGRLAGGVAHDFNNLLTVILGRAELLLAAGGQTERGRKGVEEIRRVAERAADLTRQLLAFGRRQAFQPARLDLNEVLDGTEPILQRLIPEHVRLEVSRAPEPVPVHADRAQLEQVLVNLAVNARDAMPEGGTLRIRTHGEEVGEARRTRHGRLAPGTYAVLAVEDTGAGMDERVLAHLFEPFFTTKADSRGTGLGLATVFGILEQCGGHVEVDSAPGRGSRFQVLLPWAEAADAEAAEGRAPGAVGGGGETLLLVEDDDGVRELAEGILAEAGYRVLAAARARDALNLAEAHPGPIHLLLSDVIMPEMGGRELARELAAHRPETPVLYMSGYTDDHLVGTGADPEEIALLAKPFTSAQLLDAVGRAVRAPRAA